jgi:hypothetical protein
VLLPPNTDFSADDLRRLVRERLPAELARDAFGPASQPRVSDFALNGAPPNAATLAAARPAAVLVPIVARAEGLGVLLTLRSSLREAREEVGLEARFVEPLGWLDPYLTGTGFRVAPLVALVDPGFTLEINDAEVADVFETPLAYLMDPANHLVQEREWRGTARKFYAMPHGERYIWGATAGILRNLWERLYS